MPVWHAEKALIRARSPGTAQNAYLIRKSHDPDTVSKCILFSGEEGGNPVIQFSKASTSDALILNCISRHAFDSDVDVGAPSKGGPPGYMSLPFHTKMARMNRLFKLTDNGLIVGGAILLPEKDTLNIGRIFVSPEHFRKGYGVRMMQEIEAMFPTVKRFTLDTPVWNTRTNHFYLKLGYTEIRRDQEFIYYLKSVNRES